VEPKQMAQYFTLKYVNYQKLAVEASRFGLISEKIFVLVNARIQRKIFCNKNVFISASYSEKANKQWSKHKIAS